MAPNHNFVLTDASGEPVSRTYQYRKVMKPMLERKRRARINRCLDELKELMTGALQTEGEGVAKLEKADILELTVRHLHALRRQNQFGTRGENSYAERFKAGFHHCAAEVAHFLGEIDQDTSVHVLKHLNGYMNHLEGPPAHSKVVMQRQSPPISQQPAYGPVSQPPPPAPTQQHVNQMPCPEQPRNLVHKAPGAWQKPESMKIAGDVAPNGAVVKQEQRVQYYYQKPQHYHKERRIVFNPNAVHNQGQEHMTEPATRISTPPMSPKIDVDDSLVWRPW